MERTNSNTQILTERVIMLEKELDEAKRKAEQLSSERVGEHLVDKLEKCEQVLNQTVEEHK